MTQPIRVRGATLVKLPLYMGERDIRLGLLFRLLSREHFNGNRWAVPNIVSIVVGLPNDSQPDLGGLTRLWVMENGYFALTIYVDPCRDARHRGE